MLKEEFQLTFIVNVNPEYLRNLKLHAFSDYGSRGYVRMDMDAMLYADVSTPSGGNTILLDGSIDLSQKKPLGTSNIIRTVYNSSVIFPDQAELDAY